MCLTEMLSFLRTPVVWPRDPRRITAQTLLTELIADVRSISDVSSQPAKYAELLERFDGYPLDRLIEVIYLGQNATQRNT
ncbi:MAG: hypothetical protein M3526_00865 [Actinomycetota bacterium]|nr:hypothetical protein [Actinomycetota bacterium]